MDRPDYQFLLHAIIYLIAIGVLCVALGAHNDPLAWSAMGVMVVNIVVVWVTTYFWWD